MTVPGAPGASARPRILLVDDEEQLLRSYRRLLQRDYDVVTCGDAAAAIAALESDAGFSAVVCDVNMPHGGGVELHALVTTRWPSLARRFAFTSGGPARDHAPTSGTLWLEKPVSAEQLREAVANLVKGG